MASNQQTESNRAKAIEVHGHFTEGSFEATGKIMLPEDSRPPVRREVLKDVLEIAAKLLIGFAGLSYVLGLFVVSLHLTRYNLSSLDLSQLHYVMAGAWAVAPILITVMLAAFAVSGVVIDRKDRVSRWSKVLGIVSATFVAIFLFAYVAGYFSNYFGVRLSWINWLFIPLLGVVALVFAVLACEAVIQALTKRDGWSITAAVVITIFGALLCVGYLVLFARRTYQDIPWSTGGGRSSVVQLVLSADAKPSLETIGVRFLTENRTDSLQLLLATEKQYIIINSDGRAVSIPADAVKFVLYQK